jgi:hypothetical protein
MSQTETRHARRRQKRASRAGVPLMQPRAALPAADQGVTAVTAQPVTFESDDTAEFLRYRLRTANGNALEAHRLSQAACSEATKQEQLAGQLQNAKQELLAQLKQVETEQETAVSRAEQARAMAATHAAEHEEFKKRATDAQMLLTAAGEDVDTGLPSLPSPNGTDPAGSTRRDLPIDPLTAPLERFNGAHDQQEREEAGGDR